MICRRMKYILLIWTQLLLTTIIRRVGALDEKRQYELIGPSHFVALGGEDLVIRYRLSHLDQTKNVSRIGKDSSSSEEFISSPCLFFRLSVLQDEKEIVISSLHITQQIDFNWKQISFDCGLVVKGGEYIVELVQKVDKNENCVSIESSAEESIVASLTVQVVYPMIDFDVPKRLETYSASVPITFGLTRTLCKPKVTLPQTELRLSVCQSNEDDCSKDFAVLFDQPFVALQKEGSVTVKVDCVLWARNVTYRLQILEKFPRLIIARSQPIKVEWSSRFSLNMTKKSILPCRGTLRVAVSYPNCSMLGKDKIRIHGYESAMVPSLVTSSHSFYIGEQPIRSQVDDVVIKCSMFPQRFSKICFQYINTAIDGSVAVVLERCIPMHPLPTISDGGGWGEWSAWSSCSSTCGAIGKKYRFRFCDSPPPSTSSTFCKGDAIEEVSCGEFTGNCSSKDFTGTGSPTDYTDAFPSSYDQDREDDDTPFDTDHEFPSDNNYDDGDGDRMNAGDYGDNLWAEFHGHHVNFSWQPTDGCECGCHLRDLTPGVNNTLMVDVAFNDSSCQNDSLTTPDSQISKLQWTLHARDSERRIRVVFMDWSIQCISLAVRDGDTTDSNILRVISGDKNGRRNGLMVQSNGPVLTLTPTIQSHHANCSSQYIFFIMYSYDFLSAHVRQDNAKQGHSSNVESRPGLRGMTLEILLLFLLKCVLAILSVALVCSAVGVFVTRVRVRPNNVTKKSRDRSKSLSDNLEQGEGEAMIADDSSRSTSVTLMSFDYALWKQCRLMKLKYFLLRPRNNNSRWPLRTKSVPTTPISSELQIALLDSKRPTKGNKIHKSPSYPENDLKARLRTREKERMTSSEKDDKTLREISKTSKGCLESSKGNASRKSSRKDKKKSQTDEKNNFTSEHMKLEKENFNIKRKANEMQKEKDVRVADSPSATDNDNKRRGVHEKDMEINGRALDSKSQISYASSLADFTGSSSHRTGPASQFAESIQDFEMDYYDYDVANASNIPGSYLGLEPTFVLWNSEVDTDENNSYEEVDTSQTAIIDVNLKEQESLSQ